MDKVSAGRFRSILATGLAEQFKLRDTAAIIANYPATIVITALKAASLAPEWAQAWICAFEGGEIEEGESSDLLIEEAALELIEHLPIARVG